MAVAPLVFAAGASLASAAAKESQASIERGQAEVAAKTEELRLKQREADRKDRLASAISTQNALAGARGVAAFEGSPLTVLQDSLERERVAGERDAFSTELNALALRSNARTRQRMQRFSTAASLFNTARGISMIGGTSG